MTLTLWTAKGCSERNRFGLFIRTQMECMFIHLLSLQRKEGVRDTTDIMEKYRKGALGALPDPELINSLLSIKGNVREGDAHDK